MKMDYNTYEYSIIKKIYGVFKIKNIEFSKEKEDIIDEIIFNFDNDFRFVLERNDIKDMFECDYDIEIAINVIKEQIGYAWGKIIKR